MDTFLTAFEANFLDSAVYNDVSGRVYLDSTDSSDYPQLIYSIVSAPKERTFSEQYVNILLQVSLLSAKSAGRSVITTMYNDLVALLDEKTFTITGYTIVWMRETNLVTFQDDVSTPLPDGTTGIMHWAVDWDIRLSLN